MSSVMNSANRQTFYGISHILTYIKKESEKFILKNIKVSVYCSGCGEGKYSTVPLPQSGFIYKPCTEDKIAFFYFYQ